jgi:putative chitinase
MSELLTTDQLLRVMPDAGPRASVFLQPLLEAFAEFDIDTPRRRAAFLAQVAHETGQLHYLKEIASGEAYEPPSQKATDLGNTQPGDGRRFPGRGLLQATGRGMYGRLSKALAVDLVGSPELLEAPPLAARSAGYIWTIDKRLNVLADTDQFAAITHRINGGYNGLDSRIGFWLRARKMEEL